jgi:hypothetical protein
MAQLIRAISLLSVTVYATYELSTTAFIPQWKCRKLPELKDPEKLAEVTNIMQKMNIPEEEIKRIKIYEGDVNSCLGSAISVTGAALILKKGLVHFMGRPDDMNYDDSTLPFPNSPIPLRTEILAQSEICPFALQREAIIGHELAHYKDNHSFLNVNILLLLAGTGVIMVRRPGLGFPALIGFCMASGIYHHTIETKADAIAAKTLGPKVLNSMIEMNKARLTYEEILWDMGDAKVKAQLLTNHLRAMIFHVPTKNRLAALYRVKNELMQHKYDLPKDM